MGYRISNNVAMDSLFNTLLIGLGRLLTTKSQTSFHSSVMILLGASRGPGVNRDGGRAGNGENEKRNELQVATDGIRD